VRRELVPRIPDGVNDDLYVGLTVVSRGRRFVFEPDARATVSVPSRSFAHELTRRRRITARSLRTLALRRELFDPRRGTFALGMAVNRLGRRLLPFFVLALLASNVALAARSPWMMIPLAPQVAFYLAAALHPLLARRRGAFARACSLSFYFCIGNVGTVLGVADFARGRQVTRWKPRKSGAAVPREPSP